MDEIIATVQEVSEVLMDVLRKHFRSTASHNQKIKMHVDPEQNYAGIKETTLFRGYSLMRLNKYTNIKKGWPKAETWLEYTPMELAEVITITQ